jgi:hypothetical protein
MRYEIVFKPNPDGKTKLRAGIEAESREAAEAKIRKGWGEQSQILSLEEPFTFDLNRAAKAIQNTMPDWGTRGT